jgi:putative ABC transport system substrate-binding protein
MEPIANNKITGLKSKQKLQVAFSPISKLIFSIIFLILTFSNEAYAQDLKVIAITQIVEHQSLEQAKRGILDELKDNGYEDNKTLKIIYQNAQGSITNAALIAKNFVSIKPDAIVAISTPSAQSVFNAAKNSNIPMIFSSLTDPVAAGLIKDLTEPNPKITGSMDFPSIVKELELIEILLPSIKKIGLLYSSAEANSVKTIELIKTAINNKWQIIDVSVSNANESINGFSSLIGKVDAVYIPSDNTIFSAIPKLVQISRSMKLPIFSSDPDSVIQGFTACAGYTQYEVGRAAGKLLVKILNGEKTLHVIKPEKLEILINEISAKRIGIKVPLTIDNINVKIIKE